MLSKRIKPRSRFVMDVFGVFVLCGTLCLSACASAPSTANGVPDGRAAVTGEWSQTVGDIVHIVNFVDDGVFTFHAHASDLPVSRAMGRWSQEDEVITLTIEAHEPEDRPFPYPTTWHVREVVGEKMMRIGLSSAPTKGSTWTYAGPASDRHTWVIHEP